MAFDTTAPVIGVAGSTFTAIGSETAVPAKKSRGHSRSAAAEVRRKALGVVRAALKSEAEKPLELLLDNMHWSIGRARTLERLMGGIETPEMLTQIIMFRELAGASARDAIRYMHAPMAAQVAKGQTGVQVNFTIDGLNTDEE